MRTEFLSGTAQELSEDSGNDSDSSSGSSKKKVQFIVGVTEASEKSKSTTPEKPTLEKRKSEKKGKKLNCFKASSIDRGDIPDGSDLFRQVLKEIQTQESESEGQKGAGAHCGSPPLKSILKKR